MRKQNNYIVKEIDYKIGKTFIETYHYSKKVSKGVKLTLGVFEDDTLQGVLMFNHPIRSNSTTSQLVENSTTKDMLELGRMAMLDTAPKFSESKAIGKCIKWLKSNKKDIKYILSYSDQKQGNLGIIYQATNWLYLGYTTSQSFYKLDGEIIHNISIWHRHKTRSAKFLIENYNQVSKIIANQHIYIYPLQKNLNILKELQSYPKKENFQDLYREITIK
jgi:hypothetical protein